MKLLLEAYDTSIRLNEDGSVDIVLPDITLPPVDGESRSDLSKRVSLALEEIETDMYALNEIWQHCGALRDEED